MSVQRSKWFKPAVLATVLATAGGLGVAAAKSGDRGPEHCARHDGGHGRMGGMFMPGRHIDGKLAFLKAELKITAEQEAAWQAFADMARAGAATRAEQWQAHRERRRELRREAKNTDGGPGAYDAPALDERLDRGIAFMEQRLAQLKEMGEAAKKLYGELTAEQQETADRLMSRRHGRRHMLF